MKTDVLNLLILLIVICSIINTLLDVFNKAIDTYTKLQLVKKKKTYLKRHKQYNYIIWSRLLQ